MTSETKPIKNLDAYQEVAYSSLHFGENLLQLVALYFDPEGVIANVCRVVEFCANVTYYSSLQRDGFSLIQWVRDGVKGEHTGGALKNINGEEVLSFIAKVGSCCLWLHSLRVIRLPWKIEFSLKVTGVITTIGFPLYRMYGDYGEYNQKRPFKLVSVQHGLEFIESFEEPLNVLNVIPQIKPVLLISGMGASVCSILDHYKKI